jgi:hypothetical protein
MVLLQFTANSANDDVRIRNAFTARNLKIVEVCCVFPNSTAYTVARVDIEPLDSLVNSKDNVISVPLSNHADARVHSIRPSATFYNVHLPERFNVKVLDSTNAEIAGLSHCIVTCDYIQ